MSAKRNTGDTWTFTLSGDGESLTRSDGVKWTLDKILPKTSAEAKPSKPEEQTIPKKSRLTGTKWERKQGNFTIEALEFHAGNVWKDAWRGTMYPGYWTAIGENEATAKRKTSGEEWTFKMSPDGQSLTRSDGYVWTLSK